jgi:hypothetical protein
MGDKIATNLVIRYAATTLFIIFILQTVLLFLTTGNINILDSMANKPKGETIALLVAIALIKPFAIAVGGYYLARHIDNYRLRNAFVMGAIIGLLISVNAFFELWTQLSNFSELTPATQRRFVFFIPQQIIRNGLSGLMGAAIFNFFNKRKKS